MLQSEGDGAELSGAQARVSWPKFFCLLSQDDVLSSATDVVPAIALQLLLQADPIKLAIAQEDDCRLLGHQLGDLLHQSQMAFFRQVALGSCDHQPPQRQGSLSIDDTDDQRLTALSHRTPIKHQGQRVVGQTEQQGLSVGGKIGLYSLSAH